MHAPVDRYMDRLGELIRKVAVTGSDDARPTFDEGISRFLDSLRACHSEGNTVLFIGNGGSAAIASHQATDYWKCGGIRALAFNDSSLLTCVGNDFGYPHVFEKPVRMFARKGDLLVAISSSGKSPNILNGATAAREVGCGLVTLSGFSAENPLRRLGDLNFYVPSDRYGFVEITHLAILHCALDLWSERRAVSDKSR